MINGFYKPKQTQKMLVIAALLSVIDFSRIPSGFCDFQAGSLNKSAMLLHIYTLLILWTFNNAIIEQVCVGHWRSSQWCFVSGSCPAGCDGGHQAWRTLEDSGCQQHFFRILGLQLVVNGGAVSGSQWWGPPPGPFDHCRSPEPL